MIIQYDGDQKRLFVTNRNDPALGTFTVSKSKEEFESEAGVNASNYESVYFDPDQGSYSIRLWGGPTEAYEDPSEQGALNWINNHKDALLDAARAKYAEEIGWVSDGADGYIPYEESLDLVALKTEVIKKIRFQAFAYANVILTLSKVDELLSLGIGPQINNRLQEIRTWKNDQEAVVNAMLDTADLLAYVVPEYDAQAESDVNYVFGLF